MFSSEAARFFTAEHDGEVVSGLAYFEDDYTIRYTVGASPRLEVGKERASLIGKRPVCYTGTPINYAKRKGIREYDLGGYYTGDRDKEKMRINTFKRHFGGQLVERYAYTKYYSRMFSGCRQTWLSLAPEVEIRIAPKSWRR